MKTKKKREFELIIKEALEQSSIPDEEKIREIVKDEIEKYYEKEKEEKNEKFLVKVKKYVKEKKHYIIYWCVPMNIMLAFNVASFSISRFFTEMIGKNLDKINLHIILMYILTLAITVILFIPTMILYDKMCQIDYKSTKISCFILLMYWINAFAPEITSSIDMIFSQIIG